MFITMSLCISYKENREINIAYTESGIILAMICYDQKLGPDTRPIYIVVNLDSNAVKKILKSVKSYLRLRENLKSTPQSRVIIDIIQLIEYAITHPVWDIKCLQFSTWSLYAQDIRYFLRARNLSVDDADFYTHTSMIALDGKEIVGLIKYEFNANGKLYIHYMVIKDTPVKILIAHYMLDSFSSKPFVRNENDITYAFGIESTDKPLFIC
jgi:hypothetical protein